MALLRSDIINKEFVEMVLRKAEVGAGDTFSRYWVGWSMRPVQKYNQP